MTDVTPDAKAIFFDALERDTPEELDQFLDAACGDNAELRARVEGLLSARENAGRFLGGKPLDPTTGASFQERPGTEIGRYKLLQKLGEGGMGVVYLAEQNEPVKRRVALKVIKPGMDSQQVIARFEAERQALALMDHPNIAKVLDAATTESGRPYFVMELVKGIPVTNYCDEQHLTPRERLELFVPVCQAVQHAHQKGIIHRDLKPSNVLVALYDGNPVPKVIDFGVAKATNQHLTEKTMFTAVGQIVGTLEYMSPEQAHMNQLDVDTRSDIYSLGVLLYELLTGATPFDRKRLRSAAFDEMMRIIREEEPPRPSMRLSTVDTLPSIAANRRIEPQKLRSLVRGELDWIVMKALEKDRARRYETASGFAVDIHRYLDNEAVTACPPSVAYRARKFARRHRTALGTAALVAVAVLFGLIGTTWQAIRATQQRERARSAEQIAVDAERAARLEAERAVGQARVATAMRLAAQSEAVSQRFPARSLLLAAESVRHTWRHDRSVVPVAHETLLNRVSALGGRPLAGYSKQPRVTSLSPDGRWLATGFHDGVVVVWDMSTTNPASTAQILRGHRDLVTAIAFSRDGRQLVTTSYDHTARLWDLTAGDPAAATVLSGHQNIVWTASISSDGRWLVTGSHDNTARLWDLSTADPSADAVVLEGHQDWIRSVAFSPDARWLATASFERKRIRVWDLGAEKPAETSRELTGHMPPNNGIKLVWSGDSRWLVTLPYDGNPTAWDLGAEDAVPFVLRHRVDEHGSTGVSEVIASPDSQWLVTGSRDVARVWDLTSDNPGLMPREFHGHTAPILALDISHDSRWLATGSRDRTARVWDLTDGTNSSRVLVGHHDDVQAIRFSLDGGMLITGSDDQTARLWDLHDEDPASSTVELAGHESGVESILLTPNGKWLVTQPEDSMARLWDLTLADPSASPLTAALAEDTVEDFAVSSDGNWLVSAYPDKAFVQDIRGEMPFAGPRFQLPHSSDLWQSGSRSTVAFSPNSRWVAVASAVERTARLWELSSRARFTDPTSFVHQNQVHLVTFSQDSRWLITGSGRQRESDDEFISPFDGNYGEVRLWDLNTADPELLPLVLGGLDFPVIYAAVSSSTNQLVAYGPRVIYLWDLLAQNPSATRYELQHPAARPHVFRSLALSPNGQLLAAGGTDNAIRVWELANDSHPTEHHTLHHPGPVDVLCWTPDGRYLFSAGEDRSVRMWDFSAGRPTRATHMLSGLGKITSATISRDGRWLVAGSYDKAAHLWDLVSADPASTVRTLRHQNPVNDVVISPNGRWLFTASESIRLWDLNFEELMASARALTGRDLTAEESKRYNIKVQSQLVGDEGEVYP